MTSREEILIRFEQWLDGALSREAPPAGIDADILAAITANPAGETDGTGEYVVWSAITALTQEVKLQGRAFKELTTTLGVQADRALDELRSEFGERERVLQRQAEQRSRKEILHALLDIRDRLERGLDSAKTGAARLRHKNWLQRLVGPNPDPGVETIQALLKGYELGLERLNQTLTDMNAREIRALGEPFDPRLMNAVDKEASAAVAEGIVLEVYRSGFEWNGEVFRPAQVKVSTGDSTEGIMV